jgi:hypothetical protein
VNETEKQFAGCLTVGNPGANAWQPITNKSKERTNCMTNIMSNQTTRPGSLTKCKRVLFASLIGGALALPFLMPPQRVQAQNDQREHSEGLLGSWNVQITLDPNTVPPGTPPTFMAVYTFSAGGGYIQSNTGPGAGGPAGQGNWVRTGDHKVAATQLRLGFDAANHFTSVNKIRESFTLDEVTDELTVTDQVDVYLPDGTLLPFHPAATGHGTRIAIEPLK